METTLRTVIKAVSWQLLGIAVMSAIAYLHTGSISTALSMAGTTSALGFVSYFIHEKLWQRVNWGKMASS